MTSTKRQNFTLQAERINICVHNESSSEQCCFINAGSILMAFWGFMFSGPGDLTGESAASSRPSCLGGFALSLPTCFQYPSAVTHFLARARARFCLGLDRAPAPAPRAGKAGKTEKGTRRGEERSSERASEREGWNKSETDARTCVIQRFETEQGPTIPSYSLYLPAAFGYVQSLRIIPQVEISIPPHCSPEEIPTFGHQHGC